MVCLSERFIFAGTFYVVCFRGQALLVYLVIILKLLILIYTVVVANLCGQFVTAVETK